MAKLCISRIVCACRGPVPGRHHPFASIGTSHLQNRQRNTQCETWDSWRWMAKPSALEKVISCLNNHLRSGCTFLLFRSLLVQPWAGPCTRCHPFLPAAIPFYQLPVIRIAWVPQGWRPLGDQWISSMKGPAPALSSQERQQASKAFLQSWDGSCKQDLGPAPNPGDSLLPLPVQAPD